ncbi:hypothetical protein HNV12_19480 [Methanococcoides sp. SA1]|nr:hypothetical protein [Methanococcoides sp. SA1]
MDRRLVLIGVIFLIASIYLIIFVESPIVKFVGAEVLGILAILTLLKAFEPK